MAEEKLSLIEHLEELRRRVIWCIVWVILTSCLAYAFAEPILGFLTKPVDRLIFISPHEAFYSYLKIALISGIFFSSPIILYQIWRFIGVGLRQSERKYLLWYGPLSLVSFLLGVTFAYFLVLPVGMRFLLGFATKTLQPMISVSRYISFVGIFLLAFGIVFEMPLVVLFLTKIEVVTPHSLARQRKYVVLLVFVVASILTPPDVFTQVLLAVPMLILYELSIWLSKLVIAKPQNSAKSAKLQKGKRR